MVGEQAGRPHRNRRIGWQHLHVAIDDHSRLAYAELLPGQDADSCVRFLKRAVAWYRERGIVVERVLSDNAKAYHSRAWLEATRQLQIEPRYTRIYRPRTNGKAERFIQTLLTEWAYARSYPSSTARSRALPGYLRWYNNRRPHSSLGWPVATQPHLTPLWSRQLATRTAGATEADTYRRAHAADRNEQRHAVAALPQVETAGTEVPCPLRRAAGREVKRT